MKTIAVFLMILCASCAQATESAKDQITRGNSTFAVEFYQKLAAKADGNLFFSPYSISAAFAIAYIGAGGETAGEMRATMQFPDTDTVTHRGMQEITQEIQARDASDSTEITIANALWIEYSLELQKRFLTHAERFYGTAIQRADFVGEPDLERNRINKWVETKTHDRIVDLLPQGSITPLTRLVITNAIYFLATWANQFDEKATADAPFQRADGSTVKAPFMRQTQQYGYMERGTFRAARLPYVNDALGMVVVLPRDPGGLADLEASLHPDSVIAWLDGGFESGRRLELWLPRIEMTYNIGLNEILKSMGMERPFDPQRADFSGMGEGLFIGAAIHKAFVAVTESGTEAAAATAIVIGVTSAPPPPEPFHADHPFLFIIYDRVARTVLFMGRVMDPTSQ